MSQLKPIIIIVLIIILFINIRLNYKLDIYQETFTNETETHSLKKYDSESNKFINTEKPNLKNEIKSNTEVNNSNINGFLNIYNTFGNKYFKQDTYSSSIPTLIIESYPECPTLFDLFRSFPILDAENKISEAENKISAAETNNKKKAENELKLIKKQYSQNENATGISFRVKIQKVFFNIDEGCQMDYPLLDIKINNKKPKDNTDIIPQLKFFNNSINNSEYSENNSLDYISTGDKFNNKNINFYVKENYTTLDILRFMDFCFTTLCWGAIDINLMKHVNNHYYAFPCQNKKCNSENKYFYLLPTRIFHMCRNEGKEYSRAKCNRCSSNVIVYFNTIPEKFKNLKNLEGNSYTKLIPSPSIM